MTNEEYLIVSYFVVGVLAVVVSLSAYLWLRPTMHNMSQKLSGKYLPRILRKTLPVSLLFPALIGFCSVTFRSCEKDTYEKIIAERAYLVAKNQEQLSATFYHASVGIFVFGLLVLGALIAHDCRHRKKDNG